MGHRAIKAIISIKEKQRNEITRNRASWNFKKAKWTKYSLTLEEELNKLEILDSMPTDKINNQICDAFQKAA